MLKSLRSAIAVARPTVFKPSSLRLFSGSSALRQEEQNFQTEVPQRQPRDPATGVFVARLSGQTAWQTIKDHFNQVGNVNFVKILRDPAGQSRGVAIVYYNSAEEAREAVAKLDNSTIENKTIVVKPNLPPEQRPRREENGEPRQYRPRTEDGQDRPRRRRDSPFPGQQTPTEKQ